MSVSAHSLTNIPKEVLLNILKETDFGGLQSIRKVSYGLRHFVDNNSFDLKTKNIFFFAGDNNHNRTSFLWETYDDIKQATDYAQIGEHCRVTCSDNLALRIAIRKEHRFDLMYLDIVSLLTHQQSVLEFFAMRICHDGDEQYHADFQAFLDKLVLYLESRAEKLKVTRLWMVGASSAQVYSVLRLLDPDHIKELQIERDRGQEITPMDIEDWVELEHWRKLNTIKIDDFWITIPMQKFAHMDDVAIRREEFSVVELFILRTMLQKRGVNFEDFTVHYNRFIGHNYLQDFMGERVRNAEDPGTKVWAFSTPDPDRLLLCILAPRELTCFFVPHDFQDDHSDEESEEDEEDEDEDEDEDEEEEEEEEEVDSEDEARRQAEEDERERDRLFVQRIGEDVIARVNARFPQLLAQALPILPPQDEEEVVEEEDV